MLWLSSAARDGRAGARGDSRRGAGGWQRATQQLPRQLSDLRPGTGEAGYRLCLVPARALTRRECPLHQTPNGGVFPRLPFCPGGTSPAASLPCCAAAAPLPRAAPCSSPDAHLPFPAGSSACPGHHAGASLQTAGASAQSPAAPALLLSCEDVPWAPRLLCRQRHRLGCPQRVIQQAKGWKRVLEA